MEFSGQDELVGLLNDLHNGSEQAFDQLYKRYFKRLYQKVFQLVKTEEIADELVQELFLKVWQKRREIDTGRSFEAFLFTIANNLVYDHFRMVARDQKLTLRLLLNATDYYLHSDEVLENKESRKLLLEAIDSLSPQRKQVFTLGKLEGKSYEEISRELGISVATVNTHMTQSLKIVRAFMIKNYQLSLLSFLTLSCCKVF